MFRLLAAAAALLAAPLLARIEPFPANFRTQMVQEKNPQANVKLVTEFPAK